MKNQKSKKIKPKNQKNQKIIKKHHKQNNTIKTKNKDKKHGNKTKNTNTRPPKAGSVKNKNILRKTQTKQRRIKNQEKTAINIKNTGRNKETQKNTLNRTYQLLEVQLGYAGMKSVLNTWLGLGENQCIWHMQPHVTVSEAASRCGS